MEFEPRIARMRERLKQMERQAQNLKDEASLQRELRLILGRQQDFVSKIQEGLHLADWSTRRDIIRALVKRVEIDQEHVHVIFRINPLTPSSPSEKNTQSLQHCGGRADGTLRDTAVGGVIAPILYIASIEHGLDEAKKAFVLNLLRE
jgi:site-specific DNA recombinase